MSVSTTPIAISPTWTATGGKASVRVARVSERKGEGKGDRATGGQDSSRLRGMMLRHGDPYRPRAPPEPQGRAVRDGAGARPGDLLRTRPGTAQLSRQERGRDRRVPAARAASHRGGIRAPAPAVPGRAARRAGPGNRSGTAVHLEGRDPRLRGDGVAARGAHVACGLRARGPAPGVPGADAGAECPGDLRARDPAPGAA